jgi:hypothetical protein
VIVVPLSSSPKASPPILVPIDCDGRPAVAVSDQIRPVSKERLISRVGVATTEEMAALEDALRQIMQRFKVSSGSRAEELEKESEARAANLMKPHHELNLNGKIGF